MRAYEVLAQVLPVLFFALIVQYRRTPLDLSHVAPRIRAYVPLIQLLIMLSIGFAEVAAVSAVASGHPSLVERVGVRVGFGMAGFGLFVPVLLYLFGEMAQGPPWIERLACVVTGAAIGAATLYYVGVIVRV